MRRTRAPLLVLGLCVVAAVYVTWPLATGLGHDSGSEVGDPMELAWIFAWFAHGIVHQPLHVFDGNIFWPKKGTLAFTEPFIGISVFVAPLYWATHNALLAVNVATLLVYVVGGFGMALLTEEITGSWPAGAVAGVAFTVAPYRVLQIGHLHTIAIHLMPYVLWLLLRMDRPRVMRRWLVIAVLVGLQFWSSLTGGAMTLIVVAVWAVWTLVVEPRRAGRRLLPAAAGVALGLVLAAPLVLVITVTQRAHPEYRHSSDEVLLYSARPASYLSPARGGSVARHVYARMHTRFADQLAPEEKELFPGFVLAAAGCALVGAAVVAIVRRRRDRGWPPWSPALLLLAAIGVTGFVLSLGPRLGGRRSGLPLPYLALNLVPGALSRVPARFGELTIVALAAGLGLLVARVPGRWRLMAAAAVLVALGVEAAPHNIPELTPRFVPTAPAALRRGAGPVLALPMTEYRDDGTLDDATQAIEATQMYLSTAHFRPLVNGYAAFFPDEYRAVDRAVQDLPSAGAFTALHQRHVDTVVVQTVLLPGTRWEQVVDRLRAWPGVRQIADSSGVVVFDVSGA